MPDRERKSHKLRISPERPDRRCRPASPTGRRPRNVTHAGGAYGLEKLGTEKLHPIVARGILIDFAAARGVDSMNAGECASMDDVRTALENQGMADFEFAPGDAVHVFIQR